MLSWAGLAGWAGLARWLVQGMGVGNLWRALAAFGIEILHYRKPLLDSGLGWLAGWMAGWMAGWLAGLSWAELDWAGLGWLASWAELSWAGLGWVGWAGLAGWADWAWLLGWRAGLAGLTGWLSRCPSVVPHALRNTIITIKIDKDHQMIFHDQELTMVFIRYHDRSCGSVCDHQCALMSTTA